MSKITKNNISFKIGNSVRVNNGTLCPDVEDLNIGGWQGRVSEVTEEEVAKTVEKIHKIYSWSWLGEEGLRIQKVFAGVDEEVRWNFLEHGRII